MLYLLDTNTIIAAMKGHEHIRARLESTPLSSLVFSPIVLGELEFGAEKSAFAERNRAKLAAFAERIPLSAINADVSRCYGRIRFMLERNGTPIGANDTWIAAHALVLGATVVTDNVREFSRVEGLPTENWLNP